MADPNQSEREYAIFEPYKNAVQAILAHLKEKYKDKEVTVFTFPLTIAFAQWTVFVGDDEKDKNARRIILKLHGGDMGYMRQVFSLGDDKPYLEVEFGHISRPLSSVNRELQPNSKTVMSMIRDIASGCKKQGIPITYVPWNEVGDAEVKKDSRRDSMYDRIMKRAGYSRKETAPADDWRLPQDSQYAFWHESFAGWLRRREGEKHN
jgi:hypothetical protein